jgi:hypothetical protein
MKATLYNVKGRKAGSPVRHLPERGKTGPEGRGWKEYREYDPNKAAREGMHLDPSVHRHSAASLLSYLESRPGIQWPPLATRRLTEQSRNARTLSGEEKERARDVAAQLGLSQEETMDLYEILLDAEEYGLELDFEIGGYEESNV